VVRVSFHTVEKVIVGRVEQVGDGRNVVAAVSEPFGGNKSQKTNIITNVSNNTCPY